MPGVGQSGGRAGPIPSGSGSASGTAAWRWHALTAGLASWTDRGFRGLEMQGRERRPRQTKDD